MVYSDKLFVLTPEGDLKILLDPPAARPPALPAMVHWNDNPS